MCIEPENVLRQSPFRHLSLHENGGFDAEQALQNPAQWLGRTSAHGPVTLKPHPWHRRLLVTHHASEQKSGAWWNAGVFEDNRNHRPFGKVVVPMRL
jgi:hypothetical protein